MARMRRIWLGFTASVFASVLLLSMIAVPVANAAYGIGAWVGYFSGTDWSGSSSTRFGTRVIQEGMHTDSIDSFVGTVRAYLGGSGQQRVGASFIVCTMLGYNSRSGCGVTPSASQINDWDVRVRQYATANLIDWDIYDSYTVNTIAPCVYAGPATCGTLRGDVVWHNNSGSAHQIRFRNPNGTTAYIIKRECANPLGGIVGLPSLDPLPIGTFDLANCTGAWGWVFDRSRSGKSIAAHLQVDGDTKIWGTANTSRPDVNAVHGVGDNHGFSFDISSWVSDGGSHTVRVYTYNINSDGDETGGALLIMNGGGIATSDPSLIIGGTRNVSGCVNYDLTPSISTNTIGAVETGTKVAISPVVTNGGTTTSSPVTYELNSFLVAPGNDVPRINSAGYYDSDTAPCDFYIGNGVSNCDLATFTDGGSSKDTFSYPVGTHKYTDRADVAEDLAVGTKVCYTHSVKPRSHLASQWRHSNPTCITIGVKPKVQILGSDLSAGRTFMGLIAAPGSGNIKTSTSTRTVGGTDRTLGSWVEYGVQASGDIFGIGSGSAYAGSGLADATICMASPLTFTNGTNSACAINGSFGGYQANQNIPDVGSSFPVTSSTASLGPNPVNLSGLRGLYTATGNVSVSGGAINSGRWVVLNVPNSTVTITGNINYTNANLNSAGDIPQVVIIAKNIDIQPGVKNVDAWLIAKGSATADGIINTCATSGANDYKKLSPCDKKLTVNGPVMANKVYLRRTSNSSTGVPAEVFNLRPDAYMWAYARSVGGARVQTVYSTELPPRL